MAFKQLLYQVCSSLALLVNVVGRGVASPALLTVLGIAWGLFMAG